MNAHPTHPGCTVQQRGFTLIEVLIACGVIGILAGITVPTYVARRISANESAIVATMRAISQAQLQCRTLSLIDTNADGVAEFATLPELSGNAPLRSTGERIESRLLSLNLGKQDANGHAMIHGYRIAVYLPNAAGEGVIGMTANNGTFDAGRTRDYFTCLAWPMAVNVTGHHAYFLNQQGQAMKAMAPVYSGLDRVPPAGAALLGTASPRHVDAQLLAVDVNGSDGVFWTPVH